VGVITGFLPTPKQKEYSAWNWREAKGYQNIQIPQNEPQYELAAASGRQKKATSFRITAEAEVLVSLLTRILVHRGEKLSLKALLCQRFSPIFLEHESLWIDSAFDPVKSCWTIPLKAQCYYF
jgi:hypothetical protein